MLQDAQTNNMNAYIRETPGRFLRSSMEGSWKATGRLLESSCCMAAAHTTPGEASKRHPTTHSMHE